MKIIILLSSILILFSSIIYNHNVIQNTDKKNIVDYIISNTKYDIENIDLNKTLTELKTKYGGKIKFINKYTYSNSVNKYKAKRILNFLNKKNILIDNIKFINNYPNIQIFITIKENNV